MSFADELRDTKRRNPRAEELKEFAKMYAGVLKGACRRAAEEGKNSSYHWLFEGFIEYYYEKNFVNIYTSYRGGCEKKVIEFLDTYSEDGKYWQKMRQYFYHHKKGRPIRYYEVPWIGGLYYEDAVVVKETLQKILENDGLNVEIELNRWHGVDVVEPEYVEYRAELDKFNHGSEKSCRADKTNERTLYDVRTRISW